MAPVAPIIEAVVGAKEVQFPPTTVEVKVELPATQID
jgi:hypothetical protein